MGQKTGMLKSEKQVQKRAMSIALVMASLRRDIQGSATFGLGAQLLYCPKLLRLPELKLRQSSDEGFEFFISVRGKSRPIICTEIDTRYIKL